MRKQRRNILGFGRGGMFSTSSVYKVDREKWSGRKGKAALVESKEDALLDQIAKSLSGKPYKSLSRDKQAVVRSVAKKANPGPYNKQGRAMSESMRLKEFLKATGGRASASKYKKIFYRGLDIEGSSGQYYVPKDPRIFTSLAKAKEAIDKMYSLREELEHSNPHRRTVIPAHVTIAANGKIRVFVSQSAMGKMRSR